MALFSNKEKRASRLTQFYQIAVTPEQLKKPALLEGSELDIWLFWEHYGQLAPLDESRASWISSMGKKYGKKMITEHVHELAVSHGVVRRVMDAAADSSDLTRPADEGDLNLLIEGHLSPPIVIWDPGAEPRVTYMRAPKVLPVRAFLLVELVEALNSHSLARCEVCRSVFQSRRGVKYCSDRCNSRAQSQRFYERHKEKEGSLA